MPRALIYGIFSVVILYMLIQLVAEAAVPNLSESSTPLLDASSALFGELGASLLMMGIVTSVAANLMSNTVSYTHLRAHETVLDLVCRLLLEKKGVKILGETNILNKLPVSASNLYAKNVFNFISNLYDKENKKLNINLEDEIIEKTLIK